MAKCYNSMNELSRGNYKKVGVLHERPLAPAVTVETTHRKPLLACFGKGKGFALAGTGDAVETLSRD